VFAPDGTAVGTIGREGVVLLRAPAGTRTFAVRWQEAGEPKQCHVSLPSRTDAPGIVDTPCTE
jgi:outer membrane usher protein FimD/PapC